MKKQTPANPIRSRRKPLITALEPRILLDGAAVATTAEMTTDVAFQDEAVHTGSADQSVHFAAPAPTGSEPGSRREVAFVDTAVEDHQSLVDGLGDNIEVILVDGSENGLEQMVAALQGQTGIDAIHLFSHGDVGELKLGTLTLNGENLGANAELLSTLGESLTEDGDLMLYGCYVGADSEGQDFIDSVAQLTQADVAASEDLTGAESLGGDWDLEVESGSIEAAELAIDAFQGTLEGLEYVDLNNWSVEGDSAGWQVQPGGRTVYQSVNGGKTYFVSPENGVINQTIQGTIKVDASQGDNDFIGFTVGYQNSNNNIVFAWDKGGWGLSGYGYELWQNNNGTITHLASDVSSDPSNGWQNGVTYEFRILYMENRIRAQIDGVTIFDVAGSFDPGRFGFFNESQGNVTYGNVRSAPGSLDPVVPVVSDDIYGVNQNSSFSVDRFSGLLANDYDPNLDLFDLVVEGHTFTSTSESHTFTTANGSVTVLGDGSFSYSPDTGFTGVETFNYYLVDKDGNSDTATVTLNVMEPNVAPTDITIDDDTIPHNASNGDVVGNLATTDGNSFDSHDYILLDNAGGRFSVSGNEIRVADTTLLQPGNYTISVRATDLRGASYDENITITVTNAAPVMGAPTGGTVTDTEVLDTFDPITGILTGSDIDSSSLRFGIQGGTDNGTTVSLTGTYGTLQVVKATGAYTYTPNSSVVNALSNSTIDDFTVTVEDSYGASDSETLTFNINGVSDNPVFEPDNSSTQVSVFSYPNLNGSDSSPGNSNENANLASIVQWVINEGGEYTLDTSIQNFTDADFADKLNASGFFFMTDMEQFTSSFDPLSNTYLPASAANAINNWVDAGGVIMMTGTAGTEDVEFLNRVFGWDLTSQTADSWSLNASNAAGTPFEGGPASLDSPSATDAIGAGTVDGFKAIYGTDTNATVAEIGFGAGRVLFLGYDFFDSGISGTGFTDTATQYGADVADGSSNTNAWVREIIPRALEYSANLSSNTLLAETNSTLSTNGQFIVSDVDQPDSVTVSVSGVIAEQRDSSGVAMASSSDQPSLADLQAMLDTGAQPSIDSSATSGDVNWTFNSNGETFNYLAAGESLVLTYELTADDGNGGTATRTLNITINGTNDAPVSQDATQSVAENGLYSGSVPVATDVDGTISSYQLLSSVSSGSLTFNGNGSYEFDPGTDFDDLAVGETRQVSFTYQATDNNGAASTAATITLTVVGSNDAPIFEPDNSSTQVSVFSYPNLNGSDSSPGTSNENANLASIVQWVINEGGEYTLDTSIQNFTDADFADKLNASGFFFMTDMESGNPLDTSFLPESSKSDIRDWVNAGGVIMMTGTSGANDTSFLNTIFNWDLTTEGGSSWNLNEANAAGTPFEGGPASLSAPSATDSIGSGTVDGFTAIYGTDANATVATIQYGAGTVIFMGYDYYSSGIAGTGFIDTATQYGSDVSTGSTSNDGWVREIIPRALEYSANLSSDTLLTESDSALSTSGQLSVSDVDQPDSVTVSVSGVIAEQRDADGVAMASSSDQPSVAELLAMLDTGSQPSIDSSATSGDVNWTFNSNGETFNYLAAGESLVLTYELTADDGNGGTATRTLNITVNGTNDAPTMAADTSTPLTEAGDASAQDISGSGLVSFGDIDSSDLIDISFTSKNDISWSGGTLDAGLAAALVAGFSVGATDAAAPGTVNWNYSVNDADLDFLAVGETITFSYTLTADDGNGGTATDTLSFTITGSNDAPTVTAAASSGFSEAGDASTQNLSDSGQVDFADLDDSDLIDISFVSNNDIAWSDGTLDADLAAALVAGFSVGATDAAAPGAVNWNYSVNDADLDFLAVGETITFSYTLTADDGNGGTATDTLS
ncbi:DUF4347 domain-containing protein, partial [Marinobacterium maritimum]